MTATLGLNFNTMSVTKAHEEEHTIYKRGVWRSILLDKSTTFHFQSPLSVVVFIYANVHIIPIYGREFWRCGGERILGFSERGEDDHGSV